MKHWSLIVLTGLLLLAAIFFAVEPRALFAADPPPDSLIFIIDPSDRMNEQIEGKTKIDMIKGALIDTVNSLPQGVSMRLIVQTNQESADHNENEEMGLPGLFSKQAVSAFIRSFSLHENLQPGLSAWRKSRGVLDGGTVVWFTAGEAGARHDPRPLIAKFQGSGGKFSFHLIGLGLTDRGKAELADVARVTGSVRYLAESSAELTAVVKEAVGVIEGSAGKLKFAALENGVPTTGYYILRQSGGGPDEPGETVAEGGLESGGATFDLVPGKYDLMVESREVAGGSDVTISGIMLESGQRVEKTARFSAGRLKLQAFRNGQPLRAFCDLYRADEAAADQSYLVYESWVEPGGSSLKLIPGIYTVQFKDMQDWDRPAVDFPGIRIEAEKSAEQTAEFLGGTLTVMALDQENPVTSHCLIRRAGEDPSKDEPAAQGLLESGRGSFDLSAGNYDLTVATRYRPSVSLPGVRIEPGVTVEKTVRFPKIAEEIN